MKALRILFFAVVTMAVLGSGALRLDAHSFTRQDLSYHVFLPLVTGSACNNIDGESYATLVPNPPPTDRPAEQHADLNLALRGYRTTTGILGLVDYGGSTDPKSPRLFSLFGDNRVPAFLSVSQVHGWDWISNKLGDLITVPPVTLVGMGVTQGEVLHVPSSGYNIGTSKRRPLRGFFEDSPTDDPNPFEVLVLYASEQRITLKYTREDNVASGYSLHLENICVSPDLLQLYRTMNDGGRKQLPALKTGQGVGRAMGNEIGVVIRDNGAFMDPRSRKDWW